MCKTHFGSPGSDFRWFRKKQYLKKETLMAPSHKCHNLTVISLSYMSWFEFHILSWFDSFRKSSLQFSIFECFIADINFGLYNRWIIGSKFCGQPIGQTRFWNSILPKIAKESRRENKSEPKWFSDKQLSMITEFWNRWASNQDFMQIEKKWSGLVKAPIIQTWNLSRNLHDQLFGRKNFTHWKCVNRDHSHQQLTAKIHHYQ